MRFLILLFFFLVLFSQDRFDGLVAIVGNNIVIHSEVLQQSQILAASRRIDPLKRPYLFEKIYGETLDNIINQFVVLDIAEKDTNLIVSNDEVDRALEMRIDEFIIQAGSKELFEEAVGSSLRQIKIDYWREIRNMMLIERYKFSKIQSIDVSRVEVNDFYDTYKDSIPSVSENFTFSIIEVPFVSGKSSQNKIYIFLDSLRNLVNSDAISFDSLAMIYSEDPGSSISGGNLGFTERGTLVHEYEEAAYALSPGEISLPVRSQFGYHLIRLVDRRGEEISSQHILMSVSFSSLDKDVALEESRLIYQQTNNDPFVFDSIAAVYDNIYDNFSGVYSGLRFNDVPDIFTSFLNNHTLLEEKNNLHISKYKLSPPIETGAGYALIYLYKHSNSYFPNPDNSWNIIYSYAKQEKQNRIFEQFVEQIKSKTFIKTFYK